jgi:hypothetical protein
MRLVSPLLKHAVYPALHHMGWLDRVMPPGGYAVVNYHGVIPSDHSPSEPFLDGNLVPPETFRRQLRFLKSHYHVIHPEDFRAWIAREVRLPPRAVLLTCDDGLLNTLTDILPILQSEGVSFLRDGRVLHREPGDAVVRGALPFNARQAGDRTRSAAGRKRSLRSVAVRKLSNPLVERGEKSFATGKDNAKGLDGPFAQTI